MRLDCVIDVDVGGVRLVVVLSPRGVDVSDVVSVVCVGGGTSMSVVDGVTDV